MPNLHMLVIEYMVIWYCKENITGEETLFKSGQLKC